MGRLAVSKASQFWGEIRPPSDKSLTHRAYMLSAIAKRGGVVRNPLRAEDCERTLGIVRKLGLAVHSAGDCVEISGVPKTDSHLELYCGNSGTTMRLLAGLLCGLQVSCELTGDESLSKRPMKRIAEPLRTMGASIAGDVAPLRIEPAHLRGIAYTTPVPSAQIKSALLLAGLFANGETSVTETTLSRDHTERMLAAAGCDIQREGLTVTVKASLPERVTMNVPADISSAAFFMIAGALLGGPVTITELCVNPTRTGVLDVLRAAGVTIEMGHTLQEQGEPVASIQVERSGDLKAFRIEPEMVPKLIDEIPVLAVLATQCDGTSEIRGASELRVKESDRIEAVAKGLTKMGADVEAFEDGMVITGPTPLKGTTIQAKKDHRIGMAFAIAGLIAEGETIIEGAETIETSFPGYESELRRLANV